MDFRSLVLKPFDPTWIPLTTLPDAPSASPQDAAAWAAPFLADFAHLATQPRITLEDAVRLVEILRKHFAEDWTAIVTLLSPEEAWRCTQAYLSLPALLQVWRTLQSSPLLNPPPKTAASPKETLAQGITLRDRLLSLASVAYHDDAPSLAEIKRIRANDPKQADRYDEIAKDLSDTYKLFQANLFQLQHDVAFPADLLEDAWELSLYLPLCAPKKRLTNAKKATPPLHLAFGIFQAAYIQIHTNGNFFLPFDKTKRYPPLAPIKLPLAKK
jgi:hypothetical protein